MPAPSSANRRSGKRRRGCHDEPARPDRTGGTRGSARRRRRGRDRSRCSSTGGSPHGSHRMKPSVYAAGRWFTYLTIYMAPLGVAAGPPQAPPLHRHVDRRNPPRPALADRHFRARGDQRLPARVLAHGGDLPRRAKLPDIRDSTYDIPSSTGLSTPSTAGSSTTPSGGPSSRASPTRRSSPASRPSSSAWRARPRGARLCRRRHRRPRRAHLGAACAFGGVINSDCHRGKVWVDGAGYAIKRETAVFPHLRRGRAPNPPPLPAVRPGSAPAGTSAGASSPCCGGSASPRWSSTARPLLAARRQLSQSRAGQTRERSPGRRGRHRGAPRRRASPARCGNSTPRRARPPTPPRRSAARSAPSRTASSSWPTARRC